MFILMFILVLTPPVAVVIREWVDPPKRERIDEADDVSR